MTAQDRPERLRVSARSVVLFVALVGLTVLVLRMVTAAGRVIGWMLVAGTVAGLLEPVVASLVARGWPRGRAVLVVAAGGLLVAGLVTYRVVDDVRTGTRKLQAAAPAAAATLERSDRFGPAARAVHLSARTESFMKDLPVRLRGGSTGEALRAAATRGVAFLTTSVLTLFLLVHGPRLADAALRQIHDERRRASVRRVAWSAYRRAFGYARGSLLIGLFAGTVAYVAATTAHVPGAAPLALWVGLWDLVPIVGAVIGAAPIIGLAAVESPWRGALVAAAIVAYQVVEDFVLQPRLESRAMRLGPFLTVAAGFAGLELRGLPGALIAVLATATVVAALDEVAPELAAQPR